MKFSEQQLRKIFEKTDGYCHLCHKKLAFKNRGKYGERGAWHVEHTKAKAIGGTDHLNNLMASCISCNLEKGVWPAKVIRYKKAVARAPYSKKMKEYLKKQNITTGYILGGVLGSTIGPVGMILGSTFGGLIGRVNSPNK